jgi:hypothetical protein
MDDLHKKVTFNVNELNDGHFGVYTMQKDLLLVQILFILQ